LEAQLEGEKSAWGETKGQGSALCSKKGRTIPPFFGKGDLGENT